MEALLSRVIIGFFSWFTCWSFSRYASSIGKIGGSAGEVAFPIISSRDINAPLVCIS